MDGQTVDEGRLRSGITVSDVFDVGLLNALYGRGHPLKCARRLCVDSRARRGLRKAHLVLLQKKIFH